MQILDTHIENRLNMFSFILMYSGRLAKARDN